MSQNGKLMPNIDEKSTKVLNLTVLQRIDPYVEEILITAGHVTFYEFNIDTTQWSRKDVEGPLFVVKRSTQPRFQFIVMNRRNTDNLVEDLLGDFEYEIQVPYLLYRNASQEVNGIWFYNARECEEVANLFTRILSAYSKVPTKSKVSNTKSEFEELEAVPTMAVIDGPLEPPSSTISSVTDITDDPAFVNFFSNAMNIGGAPKTAISAHTPYQHPQPAMPSPRPQTVGLPTLANPQTTSSTLPPSTSILSILDINEPNNNAAARRSTDLVKPSIFFSPPSSALSLMLPPVSSSMPTAPPLQKPYGAPLLQPFPPPTPPPSLTPAPVPTPNYCPPLISREKVRDALQLLVQDNQFIDMVYQALLNVHQP